MFMFTSSQPSLATAILLSTTFVSPICFPALCHFHGSCPCLPVTGLKLWAELYQKRKDKMASGSGIETNRIRHFVEMERKSFFLPGACTECHKIPSKDVHMMACSKCRLVWYCGKECQKNDWKYHKEFCKATSSVAAELRSPGSLLLETAKEAVMEGMVFGDYVKQIAVLVCQKLKRTLDILEIKIICSPKVCEICKDANSAVLRPCNICFIVFYCSEEHANQDSLRHRKFCPEYLLSLKCYHLVTTKGMPIPGTMPFRIPTFNKYKPISGTMKDYMKPSFDSDIDACLSEWVSYPLSLIYALEHTGLNGGIKKINEVKELTVLMCNAFKTPIGTMEYCSTWEYMLHFLPKLDKLNVILCEPNNQYIYDCDFRGPRNVDLCSDCISKKCNLNITIIKDYLVYKWSTIYKKEDVIYYHNFTNPNETEIFKYLPCPEPEVPFVLLGSDKKCMETNLYLMRKREKLDIILPLQLNPFRGMRPTKVPLDFMEDGGFLQYANCYIVGVQRQIKGKFVTRLAIAV